MSAVGQIVPPLQGWESFLAGQPGAALMKSLKLGARSVRNSEFRVQNAGYLDGGKHPPSAVLRRTGLFAAKPVKCLIGNNIASVTP
jgi:hypothetical protein